MENQGIFVTACFLKASADWRQYRNMHTLEGVSLREGTVDDVPVLLRLMDIATEWLVAEGRPGQWGTEKHSGRQDRMEMMTGLARSGGMWLAVDDNRKEAEASAASTDESTRGVIGAICVIEEPVPYVKPASEPELYIRFLISDRSSGRRGVGTLLMEKAYELTRAAGVGVLRVDCYAGDDQKLVKWYESQGFQRLESFVVKGWPGQVLAQRVEARA